MTTIQNAWPAEGPANTRLRHRRTGNGWLQNSSTSASDEQLANALGWFSLGLGLAQVIAPGEVARLVGVHDSDNNRSVLRAVGLREITSGGGILTQPRPAGWLWARVGGDIMDLALLGAALNSDDNRRDRLMKAAAAVVGVTLLDLFCSQKFSRQSGETIATTPWQQALQVWDQPVHMQKAITVNRPLEEVYRFWRDDCQTLWPGARSAGARGFARL